MSAPLSESVSQRIQELYRTEGRRIFATLVRLLGEFDLAEEALQEAFTAAMESWPVDGIPDSPRAWLVSVGRFRGIDTIRRRQRFDASLGEISARLNDRAKEVPADDLSGLNDDRLRLIFTCCHPALAPEIQIALTLREVCGLTTEQIASAFLIPPPTLAQRLVRGKAKIRSAGIPYEVPSESELGQRLESVLRVVYLVFNEGYSASTGDSVTRPDLSAEAIRLGRLLRELLPEREVLGLLALMLLQESRRPARCGPNGDLVLLADQDRRLWSQELISEGQVCLEQALRLGPPGKLTLQAALAAVHSSATTADQTDWPQIVGLYDLLLQQEPSPVIAMNRAVSIAMRDGPQAGLPLIEELLSLPELQTYHLAHSAQADLCRRLGRFAEARSAYQNALSLTRQEPERRFLQMRLAELETAG